MALEAVELLKLALANIHLLKRSKKDAVSDLKFIRFDDDGVLGLIDSIITGEKIAPERLREVLPAFADSDPKVADCLQRLAFDVVKDVEGISRRKAEKFLDIDWMKRSVRMTVKKAILGYGQPRFRVNVAALRTVKGEIAELNRLIDEAEDALT